jgi:hypothetical protein
MAENSSRLVEECIHYATLKGYWNMADMHEKNLSPKSSTCCSQMRAAAAVSLLLILVAG